MTSTRFALLGLLAERPYSGYELKQVVEQRFALFWAESYGQIYPELRALAAEGLVVLEASGGRRKTTASITPQGRRALGQWLAEATAEDKVRSERVLKLYFSAFTDPVTHDRLVAEVGAEARKNIAALEQAEAELTTLLDDDITHPRALAVVRLGLATERAKAAWAEAERR